MNLNRITIENITFPMSVKKVLKKNIPKKETPKKEAKKSTPKKETPKQEVKKIELKAPQKNVELKNLKDIELLITIKKTGAIINMENYRQFINKIVSIYTIKQMIFGRLQTTKLASINGTEITVPRFALDRISKKTNIIIKNKLKPHAQISTINWIGESTNNQQIVIDNIMSNYFDPFNTKIGNAGLILELDAGYGKSYVASAIIGILKLRTLIVVHNSTMLDQWNGILALCFPNVEIGLISSKRKHKKGDITVGIINSLNSETFKISNGMTPEEFYSDIDFVIFDECHEYATNSRRSIFHKCQAPYMLGLSATPAERLDKLDNATIWNIGPILTANQIDGFKHDEVEFKAKVHMIKYLGPPEYTQNIVGENGIVSVPLILNRLMMDERRIEIIVENIVKYANAKYNVLIFADRRSYLEEIERRLQGINATIVSNNQEWTIMESNVVMGGSNELKMKKAESGNVILSTYQFMGTGKSIPKMDCLILATPRKSKAKQFINRIFRLGGNMEIERQIIDIVDWRTILQKQWYVRKKYYVEKNYEILVETINSSK